MRKFTQSLLVCLMVTALSMVLSGQLKAQTISKTYTAPSSITIDGVGDFGTTIPFIEFTGGDIPAGCPIAKATVSIVWTKTDGTCTAPLSGNSNHAQTSFRIDAPSTNVILANPGTWSGATSIGAVTTTFDQAAGGTPAGTPVSGTFQPNGGNLNTLNGTSAVGTWNLVAGDNGSDDPLCIAEYTISLTFGTSITKTYTAPSSVTVDGVGNFGLGLPGVTFSEAELAGGCEVSNVNVSITWAKTDGSCLSPGIGNSFHEETSFRINSPVTNTILANAGTWSGSATTSAVTTVFNQGAGGIPSGVPVSGTFLPNGGNLNTFNGTNGIGTWVLFAGDTGSGDPLCVSGYSVTLTLGCDTTAPVAVCKDATVTLDGAGTGSITSVDVLTSASDNCQLIDTTLSLAAFTCADLGTESVTTTITDGALSTASCVSAVLVQDITNPVATCTDITVTLDGSGNGTFTAGDITASTSDNCSVTGTSASITSVTCANLGSNSVTLSANDQSANVGTCVASVFVVDTTSPTLTCMDVTVSLNGTGNGAITAADVITSSSDNCTVFDTTLSQTAFTCSDLGTVSLTITTTDNSGNSNTCTPTITVEDTINPVVTCADLTLSLDGSGNGSVTASDIIASASDNCSIVDTTLSVTLFTCANTGANTDTLWATDVAGNMSFCLSTITVEDTTSPTLTCSDITLYLDGSGNASITESDVIAASSDNCSVADTTLSVASFTCANAGTNPVTVTTTDPTGNASACVASVMVNDTTAPVITCVDITVVLDTAGSGSITASDVLTAATDNCPIVDTSVSQTSFNCADGGANVLTVTVTDGSVNSTVCNPTVMVIDGNDPVVTCVDVTLSLDSSGNAGITATDITGTASDDCGVVDTTASMTAFTCANTGANSVVLTVSDAGGRTGTCTSSVTVQDVSDPTVTCMDLTLSLDSAGNAGIVAADVISGSADNCAVTDSTLSMTAFTCANTGSNAVTVTVTDPTGNDGTCVANVTIQDNTPPVIACSDVTLSLDSTGSASTDPAALTASATDNCSVVDSTASQTAFACSDTGVVAVTLTITDPSGNIDSCTANVTVQDDSSPLVTCMDLTLGLDSTGNASISASDIIATSTDNCTVADTTLSVSSFTCADLGDVAVTVTTTDVSGNTGTCSATVTVEDNIQPVAMCNDISVNLFMGVAYILPGDIDGGSTDNCGIAVLSVDVDSVNCTNVDTPVVVTLTVTDSSTNVSTCTSSVTVIDLEAPMPVCNDLTVYLDPDTIVVSAFMIGGVSSDICGVDTLTLDSNVFGCANVGDNSVTLTVIDIHGNDSTCSATITVQDSTPPAAVCNDLTVFLDTAGMASVDTTDIDGGSTDNCTIASKSLDLTTFDCLDLGANSVVLTVNDVNGNSSTCTASIMVQDTTAPTVVCVSPFTVFLDADGMYLVTYPDFEASSDDNCSVDSLWIDRDTLECADVPSATITLTAMDGSGNTSSCTTVLTVTDTVPPVALCMDVTAYLDGTGNTAIVPADVDGGSTDACGVDSVMLDTMAFTCADVGTNGVILTVLDVNGNSSTCAATVTVMDTVAPIAACLDLTVYLDSAGMDMITPDSLNSGSTDNCAIDSLSLDNATYDCSEVGANTVTLTVMDVNGNSSTCTGTVMVMDTVAPVALCQDLTLYLDTAGMASSLPASVDNGSTDACGVDSLMLDTMDFTCADTGANAVTLTVMDMNGNSSTCAASIMVWDTLAPTAMCMDVTLALDSAGMGMILGAEFDGGSTDNCAVASFEPDTTMYTCADVGMDTLTITVWDVNGNTSTCTAMATIIDTVPPVALCMDASTYLDTAGMGMIWPGMVDGGSTDACGVDTLMLDVPDTVSCTDLGDHTVTLTVMDVNGNSSTCTATVSVLDTLAPVMVCTDLTVTLDSLGFAPITVLDVGAGSYDNCAIDTGYTDILFVDCSYLFNDTTITAVAIDSSGNMNSCTVNLSVVDTLAPMVVCDSTVVLQLDADGESFISPGLIGSGTDNCAIDSMWVSVDSFTCADIGANPVTFWAVDASGNTSTCSTEITVVDTLGITQRPIDLGSDSTACLVDTLKLDAGPGFVTYDWTETAGGTTLGTTQDFNITTPGQYAVVAVDSLGCFGTDTIALNEYLGPDSVITVISNEVLCASDTATLMALPGYVAYAWSNGDTTQSTVVNATGTYTVTVTDTICSFSESVTITFSSNPNPNPIITPGPNVEVCAGKMQPLDANGPYSDYLWSTGATTKVISVPSTPGTYSVTVENGFGCVGVSAPVTVSELTLPTPSVLSGAGTLCADISGTAYQWYLFDEPIPGATDSCYSPTEDGSYSVAVTGDNGCVGLSEPVDYIHIGTEAGIPDGSLNIYPNPTRNILNIEAINFHFSNNTQIGVYNTLGQEVTVLVVEQSTDRMVLDISQIANGVYYLRLKVDGRERVEKIVKR